MAVVEVTTFDDSDKVVYEIPGYAVKVVVEPNSDNSDEVFVEVWDEAGCHDRAVRPADQAQRVALKTLHTEYRADQADQTVVAEAV